jgi:hypothetical protein
MRSIWGYKLPYIAKDTELEGKIVCKETVSFSNLHRLKLVSKEMTQIYLTIKLYSESYIE